MEILDTEFQQTAQCVKDEQVQEISTFNRFDLQSSGGSLMKGFSPVQHQAKLSGRLM